MSLREVQTQHAVMRRSWLHVVCTMKMKYNSKVLRAREVARRCFLTATRHRPQTQACRIAQPPS
eukprot:4493541-Alexandrium_andersonii.AAC.1